jgi:hypothetical protein
LSLQDDIAAKLAPWIERLAEVRSGDIYDILSRPDVSRLLENGLLEARALAEAALDSAWPPDSSTYRASLAEDIARIFATAEAVLRAAAILGFGMDPQDVSRRVASAVWKLAFRCAMAVAVAETRQQGEKVLDEAEHIGPGWLKKWNCKKLPNGKPDHRVCDWCRRLDAAPPIEIWQEFSLGGSIGGRKPPRIYRDLKCPGCHPRCRCWLTLVRTWPSEGPVLVSSSGASFISAQDVRNMRAGKYRALTDFHRAALHELGQTIQQYHRRGVGKS